MVLVMNSSHSKNKNMVQEITRIKKGILTIMMAFGVLSGWAQHVLYEENMGTPASNTFIQDYTGWQDTTVLYIGNGTCDVRSSSASTGYGGASGGGNIMINDTMKWFQISGLNTTSSRPIVNLYCGLRKSSNENGSNFRVEFSTDSLVWVQLPMSDTLPTGTGTAGWYRVCFPNLPAHPHLHVRFSNLSRSEYRLDDIRITEGEEIVLETVATPTCTPAGGTYFESQQVEIECETAGADIYYTLDGSTPTLQSDRYSSAIAIDSSHTLKAIAAKENMYNSVILTAQFIIIDTTSLVVLPFDMSNNSESVKSELKYLPGFRSEKLGASYADGSAKFESKNAGSASLIAHLDSSPGSLSFDLKGVKGGTPASYSGILFIVCESANGTQWSTVTTLNETDISTTGYTNFGAYTLSEDTRYIRWLLAAANSGNTQLNNIVITKRQNSEDGDDVGIGEPDRAPSPDPHPNPAQNFFQWNLCYESFNVKLIDLAGRKTRIWKDVHYGERLDITGVAPGCYMIKGDTPNGTVTKKLIVKP